MYLHCMGWKTMKGNKGERRLFKTRILVALASSILDLLFSEHYLYKEGDIFIRKIELCYISTLSHT